MDECYLEEHQRCCCICVHHIVDFSHPGTDGKRIYSQRGWVCFPEDSGCFSGWSEHGLCEMFIKKEKDEK